MEEGIRSHVYILYDTIIIYAIRAPFFEIDLMCFEDF